MIAFQQPAVRLLRNVLNVVSGVRAVQGLVYPLDTVRTRLAVCPSNEYAGIWATAVRLWRKEGIAAFYRGLVPSMVGPGWGASCTGGSSSSSSRACNVPTVLHRWSHARCCC